MTEKTKKPGAQSPAQVYNHALHVKQVLVDQGKTADPLYKSLCSYIDLYDQGKLNLKKHLARAIQDILDHKELSRYFFNQTSDDNGDSGK